MKYYEQPTRWLPNNRTPAPVCDFAELQFLIASLQDFSVVDTFQIQSNGSHLSMKAMKKYNGMNTVLVIGDPDYHLSIASPYGENCKSWLESWWGFTPVNRILGDFYLLREIDRTLIVSDALKHSVSQSVNSKHPEAFNFFQNTKDQTIVEVLNGIFKIRGWQ